MARIRVALGVALVVVGCASSPCGAAVAAAAAPEPAAMSVWPLTDQRVCSPPRAVAPGGSSGLDTVLAHGMGVLVVVRRALSSLGERAHRRARWHQEVVARLRCWRRTWGVLVAVGRALLRVVAAADGGLSVCAMSVRLTERPSLLGER